MARRAGAVTIETASEQACKKGYRSWTGRMCFHCPAPGPASCGYLALYRSLQKEILELEVTEVGGKNHRTWNGVVQDEPKESSNEHVCREEHHDQLVQLFYSFKWRRQYTCFNVVSLSISRRAGKTFASNCHGTPVGIRKSNNLNRQQRKPDCEAWKQARRFKF